MRKLLVAFALTVFAAAAQAQTYPSRPVTLIVPYPAGGPSDTLARVLAEAMRTTLGQTVIIENVSGAGGSIGTGRVARSAPDGYTLSLGHVQTHVHQWRDAEPQLRRGEGFRAGDADRRHAALDRGARSVPGQRLQGDGRLDEGQSGQGDRRLGRRRRSDRHRRGLFPASHRDDASSSCRTAAARR